MVVDHLFHDEVEARVVKLAPSSANWIGTWQESVSAVLGRLADEGKLAEYSLIAENWNKNGPPKEVQVR